MCKILIGSKMKEAMTSWTYYNFDNKIDCILKATDTEQQQ